MLGKGAVDLGELSSIEGDSVKLIVHMSCVFLVCCLRLSVCVCLRKYMEQDQSLGIEKMGIEKRWEIKTSCNNTDLLTRKICSSRMDCEV